jgi:hypothetical protein
MSLWWHREGFVEGFYREDAVLDCLLGDTGVGYSI